MTRPHEIHRSGKRPVKVERSPRKGAPWSRREVHAIGVAIVADALGLHDEGLGGVMTGARAREMDRKRASGAVEKRDMGPAPIVIPSCGLLAADVARQFLPGGRFREILWPRSML